jgi:hypothetical protein
VRVRLGVGDDLADSAGPGPSARQPLLEGHVCSRSFCTAKL